MLSFIIIQVWQAQQIRRPLPLKTVCYSSQKEGIHHTTGPQGEAGDVGTGAQNQQV